MRLFTSRTTALCASLMAILFLNAGFRPKGSPALLLSETDVEYWSVEHYSLPTTNNSTGSPKKKRYDIIFDNKSEYKLDVAIRYKEYSGDWTTQAWITLEPEEKKLMGSSDEKTYFYYAKTQSKWRKQAWTGKHKFRISDKAVNKLRFRKQDIWECYNSEMCNTFAVFR